MTFSSLSPDSGPEDDDDDDDDSVLDDFVVTERCNRLRWGMNDTRGVVMAREGIERATRDNNDTLMFMVVQYTVSVSSNPVPVSCNQPAEKRMKRNWKLNHKDTVD
jgi:hypothetical protein